MELGELSAGGAAVKFENCFLGQILPSGDVDGFQPASFPPAPAGTGSHADLFEPFG